MKVPFKPGDRVKYSDVRESSIPAYKAARGTVTYVAAGGARVCVCWDSDKGRPEPGSRSASTVVLADD